MLKKSLFLFAFIFSVGFSQTNFVKAELLGPGILSSLSAILCYGLADKIYI